VTVWEGDNQDGDQCKLFFNPNQNKKKHVSNRTFLISIDGIYATVTQFDGTVVKAEFQVNAVPTNSQLKPAVAALAGGGFVVTWQSTVSVGVGHVFARVFDASYNSATADIQLDSTILSRDVTVAPTPDGGFFAVWDALSDSDSFGIYGRFVSTLSAHYFVLGFTRKTNSRYALNGTWTPIVPAELINSDEQGPQVIVPTLHRISGIELTHLV